MTEQEIADLKAKAAQLEADLKLKDEALTKANASTTSTVEELKALRTSKQEADAELTLLKSKLNPVDPPAQGNVAEEVKKVLDAKEEENLKTTRGKIEQKFKESHTEFHPDNDTGGIKYAAFQSKLARMNLTGLKTEEEIWDAFNDALVILNKGKTETQTDFNPYAATNRTPAGYPKGNENNKLSSAEVKLIGQLGWTEERYLKVKKSQPHYVDTMLAQVR